MHRQSCEGAADLRMATSSEMERARIRLEFEQLQREYRNMEATRKVRHCCQIIAFWAA